MTLVATAANEQDRDPVGALAAGVQQATDGQVERAYGDQGSTAPAAAEAAAAAGIEREVIALPDVKQGFVLLPRRWVVARSLAWLVRFRRFGA